MQLNCSRSNENPLQLDLADTERKTSKLATHCCIQYATRLRQPCGRKAGYSAPEHFSWKRVNIIKVDDTVSWYTVSISAQVHLRYQSATSARECCDYH